MAADTSPPRTPQPPRSRSPTRSPQPQETRSAMSPRREKSASPDRQTVRRMEETVSSIASNGNVTTAGQSTVEELPNAHAEHDDILAAATTKEGPLSDENDDRATHDQVADDTASLTHDQVADDSASLTQDNDERDRTVQGDETAAVESDNASDLFGDSDNDGTRHDKSDNEDVAMQEEEAPAATITHRTISDLTIPSHQKFKLAKLPKFLRFEQIAFHPDTFVPEAADVPDLAGLSTAQQRQHEQTRQLEQARIKQLTDNTIRWRDDAGQVESNARFVTWSDGTTSLQIGAEYFDVVTEALKEHHYMIDRHDHGLLESTNRFDDGVQFRPHSTATQTHKRLSAAMSMQHRRGVKTKMVSTLSDPLALRRQAEKIQIEKEKADRRADRARRKLEDVYSEDEELGRPAADTSGSRSFLPSKFLRQATERYDDEDSDEDFEVNDKNADDREGSSSPSDSSDAEDARRKEKTADGETPQEGVAVDASAPPAVVRRRQIIDDESDDE